MIIIFNNIKASPYTFALLLSLGTIGCQSQNSGQTPSIVVATASDLVKVSEPLAAAFERAHGTRVTFSFGSSGQLEQQIRQGAPFDVYAPAARSYCETLHRDGFLEGDCRVFALGRLAAWSGNVRLQSLSELGDKRIRRIALANPSHAPYGLAAQQALQAEGLWHALEPKFVYADNVAQALQMGKTGNVDVALVALALVVMDRGSNFLILDASLHAPIEQTVTLLKTSRNQQAARAFRDYLFGPEAQRILAEYRFGLP